MAQGGTTAMSAQMSYYGDTGLLIARIGSKSYLVFDRWNKGAVKTRTCTRCKRKIHINQEQMQQIERLPRRMKWSTKCLCYECAKP
jgi:hypothetical protein